MTALKYWDGTAWQYVAQTGPTGPTGAQGATGATGSQGPAGAAGPGVPAGGSPGMLLKKKTATSYDTEWLLPEYSSFKEAVSCATTANITLSGGTQTIDGVNVYNGTRVLVKNQTDAKQNGIYRASTSAWTRAYDAAWDRDLSSAVVYVAGGTTQKGTSWVTSFNWDSDFLGTSPVNWARYGGSKIAQTYTVTAGYTPLRTFNPASYTNDQLARFVATLADDMKAAGMIGP